MMILGIDGGFANTGYCLAWYSDRKLVPKEMGVIRTHKAAGKVLNSVDNVRRAQQLARGVEALVFAEGDDDLPVTVVHCICSESMSFPPHASTAAKLAMAWGVVSTVAYVAGIPIVQESPQNIKLAVAGNRKASKHMMESRLLEHYEAEPLLSEIPKSRWEHPLDALGAIVACLDSEIIKALMQGEGK